MTGLVLTIEAAAAAGLILGLLTGVVLLFELVIGHWAVSGTLRFRLLTTDP